ncbi:MAG: 3',5'-cyclic-nucleotide phosphodiesterase [Azoarcus sp.]|nr:3',5'-cyclic-nucleotide phosphodiesterase [Azoarcus sp.]
MRFAVLGCSGGIGGDDGRTTSFLVDDDTLIDCGTGVGDLSLNELRRINHVFVTHAHLDHVAMLPLLADSVACGRDSPVRVYAAQGTIAALTDHVFNGTMWPDFTRIPSPDAPALSLCPVAVGEVVDIGAGRRVTALPAYHSVPALAWCLDSGAGKLVFSGDTAFEPGFVDALNAVEDLRHLVIETAFADEQRALAEASSHLCPKTLTGVLDAIDASPQVHVCHLKPGAGERILAQIRGHAARLAARRLCRGDVLEF